MTTKDNTLNVEELREILNEYHNTECWDKTIEWFKPFGKNISERAKFLKSVMYTEKPLTPDSTKKKVQDFAVLQGDLIKTKAAMTNNPVFSDSMEEYSYYIIVPSSCSIQPKRYKQVLLARLQPVTQINGPIKTPYIQALNFDNRKLFYLPPVDGVSEGPFGFLAVFEEISYMQNEILQTVARLASLSEIGWHLFNAFIVNHFTRPSSDDLILREVDLDPEWILR